MKITDQFAPVSPNMFAPLIDSRAALAKPIELQRKTICVMCTSTVLHVVGQAEASRQAENQVNMTGQ
jgi:hypothetical protein